MGFFPIQATLQVVCLSDAFIFPVLKEVYEFLIQNLEPVVHGRGRKADSLDEIYLGVHEGLLYARKINPVEGGICGSEIY